jgi:peroxiredoxin
MARPPGIGEFAPDFTLPSTHGAITLSDQVRGCGSVLLVFYPRDHTLVCTRQLCNYRDNLSMFTSLGIDLLAINDDGMESHEAFAAKYGFPFPLLSDREGWVCRSYGALAYPWKVKRTLVLIGDDGRVWWRHSELAIFHRRADELRALISELKTG